MSNGPQATGPDLTVIPGGKRGDVSRSVWTPRAQIGGTGGGGGPVDDRIGKLESNVSNLTTNLKDYRTEQRVFAGILITVFLGLFGLIYMSVDSTKDRLADGLQEVHREIAANRVTFAQIQESQNGLIARFDQFLMRPSTSDDDETK